MTEGTAASPALFTASLSTPSSSTVTVAFATADGTATSADYVGTSGTLTCLPGTTTQTVHVDIIADTTHEPGETFVVNLTNAVNATIVDAQAVGTIVNDDPTPEIAITDATGTEGTAAGPALFTTSLSTPSSSTVTVAFATADGTATSADYVGTSGTLTFLPGTTSQTVHVDIIADTTHEPNETFVVNLTNAVNASIADAQAVGTIVNDDPAPEIAITDTTVTEGTAAGPALFTASLSTPSSSTVTVAFATADGTATSADYVGTSGTLTFLPGTTSQTVHVDIIADTTHEPDESFVVNVTNAVNASIADAQAVGTIVNDDPAPEIAITDATVAEGTVVGPALFTASLSTPTSSTVTVAFVTADGTATRADYVGTSGTLTFLPGTTSQTVRVDIIADTTHEPDETFVVNLTDPVNATIADAQAVGTIVNDDSAPEIAITDATVTEGTAVGPALFTASLSTPSSSTVTVAFATADGTATSADYVGTSGTLAFPPGTTNQTVSVDIIADTTQEPDESFVVNLTNAVNATIADAQAVGTILNDDVIRMGDIAADFGDLGLWVLYNGTPLSVGDDDGFVDGFKDDDLAEDQWGQIHPLSPAHLASGDIDGNGQDDLIVDFPGFGVWIWQNNSGPWRLLHPFNVSDVQTGDFDGNGLDEIILDVPGFGVWIFYNNATFSLLHTVNAAGIATGDIDGDGRDDAIVNFPGFGVWIWQNNSLPWRLLHPFNLTDIVTGDWDANGQAEIILDFPGFGLWVFENNTGFGLLHPLSSANMTTGDIDGGERADVVVTFPGFGVWVWRNNSAWKQLHPADASLSTTADIDGSGRSDVVLAFPGFGIWAWLNDGGFAQLHPFNPEDMETGNYDGS